MQIERGGSGNQALNLTVNYSFGDTPEQQASHTYDLTKLKVELTDDEEVLIRRFMENTPSTIVSSHDDGRLRPLMREKGVGFDVSSLDLGVGSNFPLTPDDMERRLEVKLPYDRANRLVIIARLQKGEFTGLASKEVTIEARFDFTSDLAKFANEVLSGHGEGVLHNRMAQPGKNVVGAVLDPELDLNITPPDLSDRVRVEYRVATPYSVRSKEMRVDAFLIKGSQEAKKTFRFSAPYDFEADKRLFFRT